MARERNFKILNRMVPVRVRNEALTCALYRSFIVSHLASGLMAIAVLVSLSLFGARPDSVVFVAMIWLSLQAGVSLYVSLGGRLSVAHFLSSALLAALIYHVAAYTGGLSSPMLAWILVIPVEAALSGSRQTVLGALVLSLAILTTLYIVDAEGMLPVSRLSIDEQIGMAALGIMGALGYIGMLTLTIDHFYSRSWAALRESENRHRMMTENASDLISRHDPDGRVTFVSESASTVAGAKPEALYDSGFQDRVHPHDLSKWQRAVNTARLTGETSRLEFRLRQTDGDWRWMEMTCRPAVATTGAMNAGGGPVVMVTRDISERKAQEAALRNARDEARRANALKSHFLSSISHELRTPLHAVIGFAEVLKQKANERDGYGSDDLEHVESILDSGQHLLKLVNDLLDLSKIEAGKYPFTPETIDLFRMAEQCVHMLQPISASREVEVVVTADDVVDSLGQGGRQFVGDRRASKQILINLIANAIKFSNPGGRVQVIIGGDREEIAVIIVDEGCGIPAEFIPDLGTPFVQPARPDNGAEQGPGLGLSLVKGLVALHDGRIEIESAIDLGTRISVRLPRLPDTGEEPPEDGIHQTKTREVIYLERTG